MWDDEISIQYWEALLRNAHENFEPIVEFITSRDTFNSISTEIAKYAKNTNLLVSKRDEALIGLLMCRESLCADLFEDFLSEPLYSDIQSFFATKLNTLSKIAPKKEKEKEEEKVPGEIRISNSSLEKNLKKYLSVSKENNISVQCNQFCANARLLLTFKDLGLKREATYKSSSLCWLGIKTNPPQNFRLEDFWFYEQQTGINLSVEVASVLDELYYNCKNNTKFSSAQRKCWPILEDIICFCIEENYPYLACIPAIDWKIKAMKVACTIIGKELADALLEERNSALQPLASEVIAAGLFTPYSEKATMQQDLGLNNCTRLLMQKKLSSAFNQVLSICIMYTLGDATAFAGKSKLSNGKVWIGGRQFDFLEEDYNQLELEKQVAEHECKIGNIYYGDLADRKDMLVFCNSDDPFVKRYIEELTVFINFNEKIFDETNFIADDKDETQTQKLKNIRFPKNKWTQKVEKIQRSITTAIEASNQLE